MQQSSQRVQFYWQGTNTKGQLVEGHIQASRKSIATLLLLRQGITPHRLKRLGGLLPHRIRKKDIIKLLRQIATLLKAKLPLMHALETVKLSQTHETLRILVENFQTNLQRGLSFSKTLQQYPQYFSNLMSDLVAIGEQTSQLDSTLLSIVDNEEKNLKTQRQFSLILLYPTFVAVSCISLTMALSFFVLPQLFSFYETFHVELPRLTRYLIIATNGIKSYGISITGVVSLIFFVIHQLYCRCLPYRRYIDKRMLTLPLFGSLLTKMILIRLTHTFSMGLSSGLPLLDTLKLVRTVAHNTQFEEVLMNMYASVREGISLTQSMRLTGQFSPDFLEMVAVGEESGQLSQIFKETTTHLEEELERQTLLWSKLLEPMMMMALGIIIGILLLTLYLPIFRLEVAL